MRAVRTVRTLRAVRAVRTDRAHRVHPIPLAPQVSSEGEVVLLHGNELRLRMLVNLVAELNGHGIFHALLLGFTSALCDGLRVRGDLHMWQKSTLAAPPRDCLWLASGLPRACFGLASGLPLASLGLAPDLFTLLGAAPRTWGPLRRVAQEPPASPNVGPTCAVLRCHAPLAPDTICTRVGCLGSQPLLHTVAGAIGCAHSSYMYTGALGRRARAWGLRPNYRAWLQKFHYMRRLLEMNVNVLALDSDVLLLANPYPPLRGAFGGARFVTAFDTKGGFANVNVGIISVQKAAVRGRRIQPGDPAPPADRPAARHVCTAAFCTAAFCTAAFARSRLHCGVCTAAFAPRRLHRGVCTVAFAPRPAALARWAGPCTSSS